MKLTFSPDCTFPAMTDALTKALPQYTVRLMKNPVFKWDYIEVKKNGWIGVWVRVFEDKGKIELYKCIPSAFARAMFGGLIVLLFLASAQKKVQIDIRDVLGAAFKVTEIQ